jgi:ABC-type sugar transport system permease subunit
VSRAAEAESIAAVRPYDRRSARRRAAWRRRGQVLAFMSPWILGFTIFFGYPLVMTAYYSFTHYDLLSAPRWIGLANYKYLFTGDQRIWPGVSNTLWLMAVAVPLNVLFAFGVALMLSRARRGIGFFRTVFYLPALVPPVAATLGFVYLLNPGTGPVNTLLGHLGISGPLWFDSPTWSKPSLVLLGMWGVGNMMIIFLAAVLDVPKHLYESAELDGAGGFQQMRWVTPPDDQPGDPLRRRHRGDRGPAVLHAGLRRQHHRCRVGGLGHGRREFARLSPRLDPLLPGSALPARVPLLQHGLRVRDGDAASLRRVRRHARDRA